VQKLLIGIFVVVLAASFTGSSATAQKNSGSAAKRAKCDAEARASCFPKCVPAAYRAAFVRCMKN
jgi:hypothetical protein